MDASQFYVINRDLSAIAGVVAFRTVAGEFTRDMRDAAAFGADEVAAIIGPGLIAVHVAEFDNVDFIREMPLPELERLLSQANEVHGVAV